MARQCIRKVAILGAGVMGAQIASVFANAGIQCLLFDLASNGANKNATAIDSIKRLHGLKPAPLAMPSLVAAITPANYDDDLLALKECDLIIEAIAERIDFKKSLFSKITPHINQTAILATNTSGLSINELSQFMPPALRPRFCGIHFFNPPRYMRLVELITHAQTDIAIIDFLESFLVRRLGKGVLRAKDTPNFIANRVGVFSMLSVIHHASKFALPLEVVDALTGSCLGRPKSATLRTADVVGLDTMHYVIKTMADNLPIDPWSRYYALPPWLKQLVSQGALGQKTGAGIYKKEGTEILVFDIDSGSYRAATRTPSTAVQACLAIKSPAERLTALHESSDPHAQFLWSHFRDLFHYAAVHGQSIAHNLRDVDLALCWGFGWKEGPFTTWQQADWHKIVNYIQADLDEGITMADTPLPAWATDKKFAGAYTTAGAYSPEVKTYQARSKLSVYQRQLVTTPLLGETQAAGETIFENAGVRLWHLGDDIGIVSFKTKMNIINEAVLDGINEAISLAEQAYKGLILWQQQGEHFSVGADLTSFATAVQTGNLQQIHAIIDKFQRTALRLRYCSIPTVAAIKGMVFGGGCELMLHCDQTIAACETYVGLVEAGVGLLPAGGGTKEFARRAALAAGNNDVLVAIQDKYMLIAKAEVSSSGVDAKAKEFLQAGDRIIFNVDELLYCAKASINYLVELGYQAPLPAKFRVAGKQALPRYKLH